MRGDEGGVMRGEVRCGGSCAGRTQGLRRRAINSEDLQK